MNETSAANNSPSVPLPQCNWRSARGFCEEPASVLFIGSQLIYCARHAEAVEQNRDWIFAKYHEFVVHSAQFGEQTRERLLKKISVVLTVLCFLLFAAPAFAQHTVALSWTAPTGTPAAVSYNMYRATGACASGLTFAKINTAAITGTTYTDSSSALTPNGIFCYQVTAVSASGVESVPSNQAQATIPGPPSAPTGLTVTGTT
jgi:hypothetical protein